MGKKSKANCLSRVEAQCLRESRLQWEADELRNRTLLRVRWFIVGAVTTAALHLVAMTLMAVSK